MTYEGPKHRALVFPLTESGYRVDPIQIPFPKSLTLCNSAIHKGRIYAIFTERFAYYFFEYEVSTLTLVRNVQIAAPMEFFEPKIAYPWILLTTRPFQGDDSRENNGVYGARMYIPGNLEKVETSIAGYMIADELIKTPSCYDAFVFLKDAHSRYIRIVSIATPHTPFRTIESLRLQDHCAVACYGLSVIHRQTSGIISRRYALGDFH